MLEFRGRKIWAAPIPDRMIAKPYCERVMVIGDACGTADPILYEGIYQARISGKLAAEVFLDLLQEENFSEQQLSRYNDLLREKLYEEEMRYAYKFHYLLFHSGLLESLIDASYAIALEDPYMKKYIVALFTGSQTRKAIWEALMSRKWKLVKNLGVLTSLRLIPKLIHTSRI